MAELEPMEVFAWGPGLDQVSFDPKCLAILCLLQMNRAEFTLNEPRTASISPTGELPVIRVGFEILTSLSEIQGLLQQYDLDLDHPLTPKQVADSRAFIAMIESIFYDALLYSWWMEEQNFTKNIHPAVSKSLNVVSARFTPSLMQQQARERLQKYRLVEQDGKWIPECYLLAKEAIKSLSLKLGDKDFFWGDKPTTLDAIAYGYLSLALYPSLSEPTLFSMITFGYPNLVRFCDKIKSTYFAQPLVPSPTARPSFSHLLQDLTTNPLPYLEFVLNGFQTKLVPKSQQLTKEQRVERFYKWLSVIGGVGFFCSYVIGNRILMQDEL
ncbi:hypothetical protein EDD86DRAFT_198657 [Gorgonomyces haynaldii]|nr:hypothetical protein EDD86DRAFT_198657 [Gorgonomyces haynaldii]